MELPQKIFAVAIPYMIQVLVSVCCLPENHRASIRASGVSCLVVSGLAYTT